MPEPGAIPVAHRQSRAMSLVESVANVVVGYGVAVGTQMAVFPMFGIEAAIGEHLAIGMAFVLVSLTRGFLLRRLFVALQTRQELTKNRPLNDRQRPGHRSLNRHAQDRCTAPGPCP